jgi:hypothetical protein
MRPLLGCALRGMILERAANRVETKDRGRPASPASAGRISSLAFIKKSLLQVIVLPPVCNSAAGGSQDIAMTYNQHLSRVGE